MVEERVSLVELLNRVFVLGIGNDKIIWELDPLGNFNVKSFCRKLMWFGEIPRVHLKIWKGDAPLRVKVFCWLARIEKILIIDYLKIGG